MNIFLSFFDCFYPLQGTDREAGAGGSNDQRLQWHPLQRKIFYEATSSIVQFILAGMKDKSCICQKRYVKSMSKSLPNFTGQFVFFQLLKRYAKLKKESNSNLLA
jgi:hypothetical protein